MEFCELTEMPVDYCSHCRGLDDDLDPRYGSSAIGYSFIAAYHGTCGNCSEHIHPGDELHHVTADDINICSDCKKESQ